MPFKNPDDYKEWARAYYQDNKEQKKAKSAVYYANHRAKVMAYRAANPKRMAWGTQKSGATRRGIEFLFSFVEWVDYWGDLFDLRGRGSDDLCMARHNNTGPYHPDNVELITNRQNHADRQAR